MLSLLLTITSLLRQFCEFIAPFAIVAIAVGVLGIWVCVIWIGDDFRSWREANRREKDEEEKARRHG
jgi:hypothetical protein